MMQDRLAFDEFLWESFRDGEPLRELRLSREELSYLAARYPLESWEAVGDERDGKCWYLVRAARPACAPLLFN